MNVLRSTSVIARVSVALVAALAAALVVAQPLTENFDTGLPDAWVVMNHGNTPGLTSWFRGNPVVFAAQSGAPPSYVAANFLSTNDAGTISNWLLTPILPALQNGQKLTFWTRTESPVIGADRLQVRLCQGPTVVTCDNVGATADDVGNYSTLLVDINPDLASGGYPTTWTRYSVTLTGLPDSPLPGRIAFRYFVANGGPAGTNSNYIGLDSFDLTFSPANLVVSSGHAGNLYVGQRYAEFSITVTNIGDGASTGGVSVVDAIPGGVTPLAVFGDGWTCDLATLICTRSDPLAPGRSYPPIVLLVNIDVGAPTTLVRNVTLTVGGSSGSNIVQEQIVVSAGPTNAAIPALADGALLLLAILVGVFGMTAFSRRR